MFNKLFSKYLFVSIIVIFFSGCSTIKDAKDDIDAVEPVAFNVGFPELWSETIKVVESSDLDLVYADEENKNILAQTPISAFSWGENVFIKLDAINNASATIKISCKRSVASNITSTDWKEVILSKLRLKFSEQ